MAPQLSGRCLVHSEHLINVSCYDELLLLWRIIHYNNAPILCESSSLVFTKCLHVYYLEHLDGKGLGKVRVARRGSC